MAEHQFLNVVSYEALLPSATPDASTSPGYPYRTYFIESVAAGCWIGIEDLEFRAEDDLSGDDVAQVLFYLTGGHMGYDGSAGRCNGFQVIYESAKPGQLVLKPLHADASQVQPSLYYIA